MDYKERIKPRRDRKDLFRMFFNRAEAEFKRISEKDERHQSLRNIFSFYTISGGREGGADIDQVSVFYGNKPDAEKRYVEYVDGFPTMRSKTTVEFGAQMDYRLLPKGHVIVLLFPAGTENMRRIEDCIIIDNVTGPHILTGPTILEKHWRMFRAYMEYTCLDGMPTLSERIRVWWMLFTKRVIVDGKQQPIVWVEWFLTIVKFSLVVGLSGFMLELVKWLF